MESEEKFSEDPEEQLRIENELLKLKMQAQFGAVFGGTNDIPPDIEQEFLKQVLAFQENHENGELVKLFEVVGSPHFKSSEEMSEEELTREWERLETLLGERNLIVTFEDEYPLRTKYDFVINELFPLEIQEPQEGHNWVFPYEEFHPNHKLGLERTTEQFMEDFFSNKISEDAQYLADELQTEKGELITTDELIEKVSRFHGLFSEIQEYRYEVDQIQVDDLTDERVGMGYVEGIVHYTVIIENGASHPMSGPFKCYFQHNDGAWEMFFFHLHGFSWS